MTSACHFYIVGDSFQGFAKNPGVLTVSQALYELQARALDGADLTPGLGLSAAERAALCLALRASGADDATLERFTPAAASLALTHKENAEHVMIGALTRVGTGDYVCALIVNDLFDRLSDHVTGQHLGGMLLIEAARQGLIAAIELDYGQEGRRKLGLAWSRLQVDFQAFAFPVPASLRIRLSEAPCVGSEPLKLQAEIRVEQAGKVVSGLSFDVTMFEAGLLQKLECKAARRTLTKLDAQRTQASDDLLLAG